MLKLIKQTYSDLTEFFLVLLTGVFVGSIFTLAYVKFWEEGDVTFADIGGMLAGSGTIGLLVLALYTANNWKEQQNLVNKYKRLDEFFDQCLESFHKVIEFSNSLSICEKLKNEQMQAINKMRINILEKRMQKASRQLDLAINSFSQSISHLRTVTLKLDKDFKRPDITKKVLDSFANWETADDGIKNLYKCFHDAYDTLYDSIDNK